MGPYLLDVAAFRQSTPFNPLYVVQGPSQGKFKPEKHLFPSTYQHLAWDLEAVPGSQLAFDGRDARLSPANDQL